MRNDTNSAGPGKDGGIGSGENGGMGDNSGSDAGEGESGVPYSRGMTMPVCVTCPYPLYTDEARKVKMQGHGNAARARGADGRAAQIHVARGVGYGLDDRAIGPCEVGRLRRRETQHEKRFPCGSRLKSCFGFSSAMTQQPQLARSTRDRKWKLDRSGACGLRAICYDEAMRNTLLAVGFLLCSLIAGGTASAQAGNGALDLMARITPTAARPEPVRQFTFYVLTKSYEDITKDVESSDAPPDRDKFISELKVSDQLKEWLKGHDEFDLTSPESRQDAYAGRHFACAGIFAGVPAGEQRRRDVRNSQAEICRRGQDGASRIDIRNNMTNISWR